MDIAAYRKEYGRVGVEHRDWPVDPKEFAKFAARGREPLGSAALAWNPRGQILLIRHRPETGWRDLWATPGGFADPGESPEACAIRETREETGLSLKVNGLTKVIVCHVIYEARHVPYIFFQFEGETEGKPIPGKEISDASWLDHLPVEMHFREDYLEPWMRRRAPL